MAGCVLQVWLDAHYVPTGAPEPFFIVETEFPDFADAARAINSGDLVVGSQLWTRRMPGSGGSAFVITRRQPIAFRGSVVARFQLPVARYVEADEMAAG